MNRFARLAWQPVTVILLAALPLRAQDAEVPRTGTLPSTESLAFLYVEPEDVGLSSERLEELGDEITEWIAAGDLVGAELLVVKDGRAVFHEAYGWADREERRPMERNSIFSIMSMSKSFTATAILMLAEEGKLSLDDPVRRYLPAFPDDSTTVHHLLSQTSGFDVTEEIRPVPPRAFESLRTWADTLMTDERAAPLGTYRYTDYNYNFLGVIVEEVTGIPADRFIEERVLSPLGLRETFAAYAPGLPWAGRVSSRYLWMEEARGYRRNWTRMDEPRWPFYPASHGLYATAMDYAAFMAMWLNKGARDGTRLLSEATVEEALRLHGSADGRRGYGYGWFVRDAPRAGGMPHSFFHLGIDGTLAVAFPAEDAFVVFLTQSRGREHGTALLNRLGMFEVFDGPGPYTPNLVLAGEQDVADVTLTPEERARYVGTYAGESPEREDAEREDAPGPVVRVWEESGRLHFNVGELGELTGMHLHLVPLGDHRFALGRYRGDRLEGVDPHARIGFTVVDGEAAALEAGADEQVQFSARRADPARILAAIETERKRVPIDDVIIEALETEGVEAARALHRELVASRPDSVRFGEGILNALGYLLLSEGRTEEAAAVFEMNVEAYPEAPNTYDSLADAYREAGRLEDARRNYERAVALAEQEGHENLEAYRAKLDRITQELAGR